MPVNKTHTINDPGILVGPKSYGLGTEDVEERGGQGGREEEVVGETWREGGSEEGGGRQQPYCRESNSDEAIHKQMI